MNFYERLEDVAQQLSRNGENLAIGLGQTLVGPAVEGARRTTNDYWDLEWEDPLRQALWDRLRQAWQTFTVQVMAEIAGVPVAPVTIQALYADTDQEVRRIAGKIRDKAIADQLGAMGITLPAEERGSHANS